jgi:hypothetical protein
MKRYTFVYQTPLGGVSAYARVYVVSVEYVKTDNVDKAVIHFSDIGKDVQYIFHGYTEPVDSCSITEIDEVELRFGAAQ